MKRQALQAAEAQQYHCCAMQQAALQAWQKLLFTHKQLYKWQQRISETVKQSTILVILASWRSHREAKVHFWHDWMPFCPCQYLPNSIFKHSLLSYMIAS
jgi:hypothetical protein